MMLPVMDKVGNDGQRQHGADIWKHGSLWLGGLALVLGGPLLLRLGARFQIDYSEGWNAVRQLRVLHHLPLYGARPELDFTNYPPLSFHLVAWLTMLVGSDVNTVGRVLALVGLTGMAGMAVWLASWLCNNWRAGVTAGILFIVAIELWMPSRIGSNDPQFISMLPEGLGFCLAIMAGRRWPLLLASAPLFSLAVFGKPNLLALPIGVGIGLLTGRRFWESGLWIGFGVAVAGLLWRFSILLDGNYFLVNLLCPRTYDFTDVWHGGGTYLLIMLPLVTLSGVWCWCNRLSEPGRMLSSAWLAAQILGTFWSGGDGVSRNIFFDALWLDAVLAVAGLSTLLPLDRWVRRGLWLLSLFPLSQVPTTFWPDFTGVLEQSLRETEFAQGVALLEESPGPAVCENLLMCSEAGRDSYFDPYFLRDQINYGRAPSDAMTRLVIRGQLGSVEIGDTSAPDRRRHNRYTSDFLATLPAHYRVGLKTPAFTIWVHRP